MDVQPFLGGLEIVNRLKPVIFNWKSGGSDIGLNAEDVAEVVPQFITRNQKGEAIDVKEGSFDIVFINAFKELQTKIKLQQQEIDALKKQQQEFDALKRMVCMDHPTVATCKSN